MCWVLCDKQLKVVREWRWDLWKCFNDHNGREWMVPNGNVANAKERISYLWSKLRRSVHKLVNMFGMDLGQAFQR